MLELSGADSVVSVNEVSAHAHPMRMLRVDDNGHAVLFATGQPVRKRINRRQDLPQGVGDERRHLRVPHATCCSPRSRACTAIASSPIRCRPNDRSASTTLKTGPRPNGPLNDSRTTITTITMNNAAARESERESHGR